MKNSTTIRTDEQAREYMASNGHQHALDNYLRMRESDSAQLISIPNPCQRCGGSGYGSWHQDGGRCYECGGVNTKGRRITYTLVAYAQKLKRSDTARAKKAARVAAERAQSKAEGLAFRAARPELDAALKLEGALLTDLAAKLEQYGSLSDAQVALALKVAARKTAQESEQHVAVPVGRQLIEGTVVKAEWRAGFRGDQLKAIVKVETPAGTWLVWGTVPSSLIDAACDAGHGKGAVEGLCGRRVRFTATVEAGGRDPHFGFFKRPTKAELLPQAEASSGSAPAALASIPEAG